MAVVAEEEPAAVEPAESPSSPEEDAAEFPPPEPIEAAPVARAESVDADPASDSSPDLAVVAEEEPAESPALLEQQDVPPLVSPEIAVKQMDDPTPST